MWSSTDPRRRWNEAIDMVSAELIGLIKIAHKIKNCVVSVSVNDSMYYYHTGTGKESINLSGISGCPTVMEIKEVWTAKQEVIVFEGTDGTKIEFKETD